MSSRAKAVAGPVGIHMSKTGASIRPSLGRLQAESSLSRHTVLAGLNELRKWGFLELVSAGGGRRRTSIYQARIPDLTVQQVHRFVRETVQPLPETVQNEALNGAATAQEDVKEDVHKDVTSLKGNGAKTRRNKSAVDVSYLDEAGHA